MPTIRLAHSPDADDAFMFYALAAGKIDTGDRAEALAHAGRFARGMDAARTDTFVGMYVNDFTVDYGPRGRAAVQHLLDEGHRAGLLPARVQAAFVAG